MFGVEGVGFLDKPFPENPRLLVVFYLVLCPFGEVFLEDSRFFVIFGLLLQVSFQVVPEKLLFVVFGDLFLLSFFVAAASDAVAGFCSSVGFNL